MKTNYNTENKSIYTMEDLIASEKDASKNNGQISGLNMLFVNLANAIYADSHHCSIITTVHRVIANICGMDIACKSKVIVDGLNNAYIVTCPQYPEKTLMFKFGDDRKLFVIDDRIVCYSREEGLYV